MGSEVATESPITHADSVTDTKTSNNTESPPVENTPSKTEVKPENKPSPAQDLRNLQILLISGIFPGNVAPQVVAGYNLLEAMARKIEKEANYVA